jgi:hypothetical protein
MRLTKKTLRKWRIEALKLANDTGITLFTPNELVVRLLTAQQRILELTQELSDQMLLEDIRTTSTLEGR